MIFKQFEETDIVAGRTSRVASGFWPDGLTNWSQSNFVSDFWYTNNIEYGLPKIMQLTVTQWFSLAVLIIAGMAILFMRERNTELA